MNKLELLKSAAAGATAAVLIAGGISMALGTTTLVPQAAADFVPFGSLATRNSGPETPEPAPAVEATPTAATALTPIIKPAPKLSGFAPPSGGTYPGPSNAPDPSGAPASQTSDAGPAQSQGTPIPAATPEPSPEHPLPSRPELTVTPTPPTPVGGPGGLVAPDVPTPTPTPELGQPPLDPCLVDDCDPTPVGPVQIRPDFTTRPASEPTIAPGALQVPPVLVIPTAEPTTSLVVIPPASIQLQSAN